MTMKNILYGISVVAAVCFVSSCSLSDDSLQPEVMTDLSGGFKIEAMSRDMMQQQVITRSAINKTPEESKINNLYIFLFDGTTGDYLESPDENVFKPYMEPSEGVSVVNIPVEIFSNPGYEGNAENVWVYALANVSPEVIADNNRDGYPDNFPVGGKDGKTPKMLFEEYSYSPLSYESYNRPDITKLPEEGMPMVGMSSTTINLKSKGNMTLQMSALMARIDIEFKIDSENTDDAHRLPKMQLAQWWVNNMPSVTPLTQPGDGVSDLSEAQLVDFEPITENLEIINSRYNADSKISFTFYMFENLNGGDKTAPDGFYPTGTVPDDYQRWKPNLAEEEGISEKATYIEMLTYYSTYNDDNLGSATYEVKFRFYLGANHTNNFDVGRNRHYKNDITITGLTKVGNNPDHITYDARVNISQQDNPFYISMLRERGHDAHFNVTPMDVYMFGGEGVTDMKMTVSIEDPDNHKWVRMEKIPAENMANGSLPEGFSSETHIPTGAVWHAGNGKRRYFTTDLVSSTLADNVMYELTSSRDRIYFYIDENLSLSDRTVKVKLSYTDSKNTTPRERELLISQAGLKAVTVPGDGNNPSQTIYIEQFEEYLQHYDPLDEHGSNLVYDGLPWGYNGQRFGPAVFDRDKWCNVYYNGLEATWTYINDGNDNRMDLNTKPNSAAQYCLNKNKRNSDGMVQQSDTGWFLPGIRQLEAMLTEYWNTYPEFQENFYWSSAVAKRQNWGFEEDPNRARATKAFETPVDGNNYAPSDHDNIFTDKSGIYGNAPRTEELRIRAAYIGTLQNQ